MKTQGLIHDNHITETPVLARHFAQKLLILGDPVQQEVLLLSG